MSQNIDKNGTKYNNSIFQQLIDKKVGAEKIDHIKCFGIKFFSRYDVCTDCQKLIFNQLYGKEGLRHTFIESRRKLGIKPIVDENVPFLPLYYSARPYSDISYFCWINQRINKLSLISVKRTSSIYFQLSKTEKKAIPRQSFKTEKNKIDLSLDYIKKCIFSNIRTLYTE